MTGSMNSMNNSESTNFKSNNQHMFNMNLVPHSLSYNTSEDRKDVDI